jgi:chemotaxis protein MotB
VSYNFTCRILTSLLKPHPDYFPNTNLSCNAFTAFSANFFWMIQEILISEVEIISILITVFGDLLFDSGKAKIRPEALPLLDKISTVIKENMASFNIGIEGYTDDQPIKYSGWKSNWELSTARSLSVLHYMADEQGISPDRLSAIGFGEYRPVASNDSREGRQQNRRVEIVIQPKVTKVKGQSEGSCPTATQENLK